MSILIAEDDYDTATSYKRELEQRNHQLVITDNGEDCLKVYPEQLHDISLKTNGSNLFPQPFDAVVLDYNMPRINRMKVAKEILAINPYQRIIFASAYVRDFSSL